MVRKLKIENEIFRSVSAIEAGKIFNVSTKTVYNWIDDGLPVKGSTENQSQKLDVADILKWHIEETKSIYKTKLHQLKESYGDQKPLEAAPKVQKGPDFDADVEPIFEDNLDRQRYYQAKLAKTKYKQLEKLLIPKEFYEEKMMEAGDFVRSSLQSLPKEMAIKLSKLRDAAEVEKFLEEVICDKLKEMAQIANEEPE